MIYRALLSITIIIFYAHLSFSQNPLVWFKTEPTNVPSPFPDREDRDFGRWEDHSGNDIELEYKNTFGQPQMNYVRNVYSMNYNRALYFDKQFISEFLFQLRSNINTNSTIMAVLVPNVRESAEQEDWSMRWNYGGPTKRVLTVDEVLEPRNQFSPQIVDHLLDYGNGTGTDQFINPSEVDSYEEEKYGRIVTYNAWLTGDRCTSSNGVLAKAFNLFSESNVQGLIDRQDGQIAEMMVFKKVLTKAERQIYESYLAVKYGISKELDYVDIGGSTIWNAIDMSYFTHRHTGIAVYPDYDLHQSRSNSYYVEKQSNVPINASTGRIQEYSHVHNYSQNLYRLLTISAEDESVPISGGSLVWGDDDIDIWPFGELNYDDGTEYIRLPRNWGITKIDGGTVETPSWCNFVNLDKVVGGPNDGDIQLSDEFPTGSGSVPTVGHMASTTRMLVEDESIFSWTLEAHGPSGDVNNDNIIGISDDNFTFADRERNVNNYTNFLVRCIANGNTYTIVYGNGPYNPGSTTSSQISLNIGDEITIQLDYVPEVEFPHPDFQQSGNLRATILINGVEETHQNFQFDCLQNEGYFPKVIIKTPDFRIGNLHGTGFEEVQSMGSNVELSSKKIRTNLINHLGMSITDFVPYLIIDRSGGVDYNKENTDFIKGGFGATERYSMFNGADIGFYDKVEFSSVDWDTDGGMGIANSDAFTFGFRDCSADAEIEVDVIECCGEILDICFIVKDCPENRLMDFVIESNSEGGTMVVAQGQYTIDKEYCIGQPLPEGDYNLVVELGNCNTLEYEFSVQRLDLTNLLPDDIIKIPPTDFSVDINIAPYIPDWLLEREELEITWYNDDPSIPLDQRIVAVGTEFLGATEGEYRITFDWTCANGNSCSFEDNIVVVACGDFNIERNLSFCCRSADLEIENNGDCAITVRLKTIPEFDEPFNQDITLEPGEPGGFNCLLATGGCSEFDGIYQLGLSICGENLEDDVFVWDLDYPVICPELPTVLVEITECPLSVQVDHLNMGDFGFQYDWYRVSEDPDDQLIAANTPVFPLPAAPGQYYVIATTSCAPEYCSAPCEIIDSFEINIPYTLTHEIINQCCNSADIHLTYNGLYAAEIQLHTIVVDEFDIVIDEFDSYRSVGPGSEMVEFICLGATGECSVNSYKHSISIKVCGSVYPYQEILIDCPVLPAVNLLDNITEFTIDQCRNEEIHVLDDSDLQGFQYNWYSVDGNFLGAGSSFPGPCVAGDYYVLATLCEPNESCTIEVGPKFSCEIRADFTISCDINISDIELGQKCGEISFSYRGATNDAVSIELSYSENCSSTIQSDFDPFFASYSYGLDGTGGGYFIIPAAIQGNCIWIKIVDKNIEFCYDQANILSTTCCNDKADITIDITYEKTCIFSVRTDGISTNLDYQWQESFDGGLTWINIDGAVLPTFTNGIDGNSYRIIVTDNDTYCEYVQEDSCICVTPPIVTGPTNAVDLNNAGHPSWGSQNSGRFSNNPIIANNTTNLNIYERFIDPIWNRMNDHAVFNAAGDLGEVTLNGCFDVGETKMYSIGFGADDLGQLSIDGNELIQITCIDPLPCRGAFIDWWVTDVFLECGSHTIDVANQDAGGTIVGFSFELYSEPVDFIKNPLNNNLIGDLIILDSQDDLNWTTGLECPEGYETEVVDCQVICSRCPEPVPESCAYTFDVNSEVILHNGQATLNLEINNVNASNGTQGTYNYRIYQIGSAEDANGSDTRVLELVRSGSGIGTVPSTAFVGLISESLEYLVVLSGDDFCLCYGEEIIQVDVCPDIAVFCNYCEIPPTSLCIPDDPKYIDIEINPTFENKSGYCVTWQYSLDGIDFIDFPSVYFGDLSDVEVTEDTRSVRIHRDFFGLLGEDKLFVRATIKYCNSNICSWEGIVVIEKSCPIPKSAVSLGESRISYLNEINIESINPAPASQEIQVTIKQKYQQEKTQVWIYDVRGAQIDQLEFEQEINPRFMVSLPQGVYIIKAINDSGQVAVRKLIVIQ